MLDGTIFAEALDLLVARTENEAYATSIELSEKALEFLGIANKFR